MYYIPHDILSQAGYLEWHSVEFYSALFWIGVWSDLEFSLQFGLTSPKLLAILDWSADWHSKSFVWSRLRHSSVTSASYKVRIDIYRASTLHEPPFKKVNFLFYVFGKNEHGERHQFNTDKRMKTKRSIRLAFCTVTSRARGCRRRGQSPSHQGT